MRYKKLALNLIITFLLFFNGNVLHGQTISKVDFDKAVNYLNCKSVMLALKHSPTDSVTAKFKSKCNCDEFPAAQLIKASIPESESKTVDLSNEINSIIENENIKDTTALIKLLTEDIFVKKEKYAKIYAFATDQKKVKDINLLKKELKNKFRDSNFFSNANTTIVLEEGPPTNIPNKDEINLNKSGWFVGISSQMIVVSIFFSLIFVLIFFFISKHLISKLEYKLEEIKSKFQSVKEQASGPTTNQNPRLNNDSEEIQKQIKEEIARLKSDLQIQIDQLKKSSTVTSNVVTSDPKVIALGNKFYLLIPESDKLFNATSKHTTLRAGESMYEATETAKNIAEFSICNNVSSMNRALTNSSRFIKPACEEQNEPGIATRIITVTPGKIELENDKWIVRQKAIIRYEN